jgi:cytochrome c-type biogenesis protein CcmE
MKSKKKRSIFILFWFLVSILAVFFIIKNFRDEIVFFYSPSEISEKISESKKIRVGGLVLANSVRKKDALTTEFKVSDGKKELKIIHKGLTPDLFREGQGVIASGFYDGKKNIFYSNELLVKHDENYMPPEVAKSIKHEL